MVIPNAWIDAYLVEDGDVVVEACSKTASWFGVVVVADEFTAHVAGNDDITIDPKNGGLILGVGAEQRIDLAELLLRQIPPQQ